MYINRERAAELGQQTVRILRAGTYVNAAGAAVDIRPALAAAQAGTRAYPPEEPVRERFAAVRDTRIEVTNETTLAAAFRLITEAHQPAALNFASAKHPGGGFLGGARAQEESLARASGLFACLDGQPMYDHHRAQADPMYTSYAIYSPAVPVFREDDGTLRDEPFSCAFITAPAVNAKVVLERRPSHRPAIRAAMGERTRRVLAIGATHGHDSMVLGAWGCGVFGNDPAEIAGLFRDALAGPYTGVFARVVFAILDSSPEERFIGPFRRALAENG
jgi:uncharacterized protein (TIGR02452 family)